MILWTIVPAIGLGVYAGAKGAGVTKWVLFALFLPFLGPLIGILILQRRPRAPTAPVNALRGAVHALLAVGLIIGSMWVAQIVTERSVTREVRGETPKLFPVLVVVPEQSGARYAAYVVVNEDLEEFKREHPDFSFLVPKAAETFLHETAHHYKYPRDRRAYFKVEQLGMGRQSFEVRYPLFEAHSVGWYEATAQGFEPKRFLRWHYMMTGITALPMLLAAAVFYWLLTKALNLWLWSRWRTPASGLPEAESTQHPRRKSS